MKQALSGHHRPYHHRAARPMAQQSRDMDRTRLGLVSGRYQGRLLSSADNSDLRTEEVVVPPGEVAGFVSRFDIGGVSPGDEA